MRRGLSPRRFLVDGFVAGSWRLVRDRAVTALELKPFGELARPDRGAVAEEGVRLLGFMTAGAEGDARVSVRFATD